MVFCFEQNNKRTTRRIPPFFLMASRPKRALRTPSKLRDSIPSNQRSIRQRVPREIATSAGRSEDCQTPLSDSITHADLAEVTNLAFPATSPVIELPPSSPIPTCSVPSLPPVAECSTDSILDPPLQSSAFWIMTLLLIQSLNLP